MRPLSLTGSGGRELPGGSVSLGDLCTRPLRWFGSGSDWLPRLSDGCGSGVAVGVVFKLSSLALSRGSFLLKMLRFPFLFPTKA